MADIQNVKMGVCTVSFDGTDLGHTKGGVTVTYEKDPQRVTVDRSGITNADIINKGINIKASVPLAESTLANLSVALPEGTADGDKITFGGSMGLRLSSVAGQLVLHPIDSGDSLEFDVVIYKAVVTNAIEIPFMADAERVITCEFEGMLDETREDGDQLFMIGDSTA